MFCILFNFFCNWYFFIDLNFYHHHHHHVFIIVMLLVVILCWLVFSSSFFIIYCYCYYYYLSFTFCFISFTLGFTHAAKYLSLFRNSIPLLHSNNFFLYHHPRMRYAYSTPDKQVYLHFLFFFLLHFLSFFMRCRFLYNFKVFPSFLSFFLFYSTEFHYFFLNFLAWILCWCFIGLLMLI